jgi:hypothetical protein
MRRILLSTIAVLLLSLTSNAKANFINTVDSNGQKYFLNDEKGSANFFGQIGSNGGLDDVNAVANVVVNVANG